MTKGNPKPANWFFQFLLNAASVIAVMTPNVLLGIIIGLAVITIVFACWSLIIFFNPEVFERFFRVVQVLSKALKK